MAMYQRLGFFKQDLAVGADKTKQFPDETMTALAEMGIMGLNIPEVYGDAGLNEIEKALVIFKITQSCASKRRMWRSTC